MSQLGYHITNFLLPRHWYQFADDAAAVTAMESDNQKLLNIFSRWCSWCDMIIHVGKCHSFGIKKVYGKAKQVKPTLYLNNTLINPIEIGDSFLYLGRYFDFMMSNKEHMQILSDVLTEYLTKINNLPLHQKNKINIYQRYVLPKISWHLTVTDIPLTWIKQNLDNLVSKHLRLWLSIPISGTLDVITLSRDKYGLNVVMTSSKTVQCRTTFRQCLKHSTNPDIRELHKNTSENTNIQYDTYKSTREVIKDIRNKTITHISHLTTQKLVISAIWEYADAKFNKNWQKMLSKLPRGIYSFVIRYLNNTLPNATNTFKWKISNSQNCNYCHNAQTLGHVVGGCKTFLEEKRYNWRHDSILQALCDLIPINSTISVYADIPGFPSPCIITGEEQRPDIVVKFQDTLWILELTVGFETNIRKIFDRKQDNYHSLIHRLETNYSKVTYVNLSMGACGIIGKDSKLNNFLTQFNIPPSDVSYHITKIMNIGARSTYYIFCRRNKDWLKPALMSW